MHIEGGSNNVTVRNSRFENVGHGVLAMDASNVHVENSYFKNMKGALQHPYYYSDPVQFARVTGECSVTGNTTVNEPGKGFVEDNFNFGGCKFSGKGLVVSGNSINGSSYSWHAGNKDASGNDVSSYKNSGVGIMFEGGTSGPALVENNIITGQANCGISVWSGSDVTIKNNTVDMTEAPNGSYADWGALGIGIRSGSKDIEVIGNNVVLPNDPKHQHSLFRCCKKTDLCSC